MKSASKLLFYIIASALICRAVGLYFSQRDAEFIATEEVFAWYFKFIFLGNILMSIGAIGSFILYNKFFPKFVNICYPLMIALVIMSCINDLSLFRSPSAFYAIKSPGVFINFGVLYFAANILYFPRILKIFYYLCLVFIIGGLINLSKVGLGSSRNDYLSAVGDLTVYLIWVFPFFYLQEGENQKSKLLNNFVLFITFLFILFISARSYIIIFFIYFFVKFEKYIKTKGGILIVAGILLSIWALGFILLSSGFGEYIDNAVAFLTQRSSEDSRSSQIIEFWEEYDSDYLLQGVGPTKTWYWTTYGGQYQYLDNQFLLLGWWAGLPTLLVYLYFLGRTCLHKSEKNIFENIKGIRLILILWILACLGLAIYAPISTNLYYYFISCIIGLHTCNYSKIEYLETNET